ncbi:MAG: hypothetical protein RL563_2683 [Pseudomonadota bacterium]|jgi:hypothetical protein
MITDETAMKVECHDVVQVNPDMGAFGGCMVVVTKVAPWGVQGYVQSAGVKGQQYIRLTWGVFNSTGGKAVWVAE